MSRRVMMVAYGFPPVAGAGIERTLKHTSYLPEFGWEPAVIAPSHAAYRLVEPGSVSRIRPGTEVHRARSVEPAHARKLVRRLLGRDSRAQPHAGHAGGATRAGPRGAPARLRTLLNAAWGRIIPLIFFPDEQLLWALSAASVGRRVHRRHPVDLLYSSAPPISAHLAAGMLKRRIGVPWVADFRDPWIGNSFARPLSAPYRRLQASLERWIVSRADRTVFATPLLRDRYAARYPELADRFVVIPNGYDLADLASVRAAAEGLPPADPDQFRLVYAGSLYGADELPTFLDGVETLLARRPELGERLRVEFIGWFDADNQAIAAQRLPRLDPVVRQRGFMPREEALARVAAADAGLELIADTPGREQVAGTKLYEYIGLDKAILAVAPAGEARRVLEVLGWGVVADPTADGVARGLEELLDQSPPGRAADPERRFERRNLTGALAALLDEVQAAAPEATP
jgi:glycosyltransferase involved in cell wall biosynthesis